MPKLTKLLALAAVLVTLAMAGCGASNSTPADPPVPPQAEPAPPVQAQAEPALAPAPPVQDGAGLKVSRLEQLWQSRRANPGDFPIGTGDIIAVSIPGLPDFDSSHGGGGGGGGGGGATTGGADAGGDQALDNWTVRVSGQGYINLPLLGQMHVAGLTEEQLRGELTHRLEKYMYNPQVELFVRSYNSRQVAVSGEVHSPGMFTLNGTNETLRDLIVRAGGTTDTAGTRVILTPAPIKLPGQQAANGPTAPASGDSSYAGVSDTNPLSAPGVSGTTLSATYVIDLSRGQSSQRYLNIPARPGDTIYVPRAGSATVIGWVYSPKTIDITPGLTVLNAVSQAGGTLFAADTERIKILRQGPQHETKTLMVNLNDIRKAKAPDVLVQANDVIDVPYSAVRIPGYALYYAAQGLVTMGPTALIFSGGL
jgi:polysaccharide export outer membrane protein